MKHQQAELTVSALRGFYIIGAGATFIGISVVFLLNMATPVEFVLTLREQFLQSTGAGIVRMIVLHLLLFGLICICSCIPYMITIRIMLKPIARFLTPSRGDEFRPHLRDLARQRLINLPFIMTPANLAFWVVIPGLFFGAAYLADIINLTTAAGFSIRSTMSGLISSMIVFFGLEAYSRKKVIPFFFPKGRLAAVRDGTILSISRRIRAFYRLACLVPLVNVVLTLVIIYLDMDSVALSAKEYGRGVLIFSGVVLGLFLIGSSILSRLVTRSIAGPLNRMVATVNEVKRGNYQARTAVVSNDEIGVLGDAFNDMIRGLEEKEVLRDAFGKYVTEEVRDEILSGRIPLDGEFKHVTVMFADLRNFTPMTETHDPKLVVRILNRYFETMAPAINGQSGLILQFLGDEIYAVFGAPVRQQNHAQKALNAALAMTRNLEALNREFHQRKWPRLSHGIGIHTGDVVAATIGSPDRLSYTLVGDTVNLASRLQTLTKELNAEIILSSDTADLLPREMAAILTRHDTPLHIRGKKQKVAVYLARA